MIPVPFGAPGRRLFGIYHSPPGNGPASGAVLLCNPFGQEAIRAHRLLRVLADRLARAGMAVLRFDYHGTGDSPGDDEDGDLDGWQCDVLAAHEELLRRSSAPRMRWMGARLGATLAARAACQAGAEVQRVVLWDPIVEGRRYLDMLRARHVEALEEAYSLPDPAWRRSFESDENAFTGEALGFGMSAALRAQLLALSARTLALAPEPDVHLVAAADDPPVWEWQRLNAARRMPFECVRLSHEFDWAASGALNSALVPAEAVQHLAAVLGE
jgi:exosortase A-associated hydrolase 2